MLTKEHNPGEAAQSMRCWRHGARREPTLGYCWKCLAEERDPPAHYFGSLWWRNRGWDFCRCAEPDVIAGRCHRCGKREGPVF